MERLDLLPREGNLYKANLHCHTTCSDGRLTPQQVKEKFKAHGYSVIAFTDHNVIVDHSDLNDEGFLALTGVEVDTDSFIYGPKHAFNQTCHLCLIARDPQRVEPVERSVFYTGKAISDKIAEYHRRGYIVNYNHPTWSCEGPDEFLGYVGCDGMEIYNHSAEVATGNGLSQSEFALALRLGSDKLRCVAADDNHEGRNCEDDAAGGWVTFKAPALTYDNIIRAYDQRAFYASTGPEIHQLYIEDGRLVVECSPVRRIHMMCQNINPLLCAYADDGSLTRAELRLDTLPQEVRFVWVHLTDQAGKKAWANPYFL